MKNYTYVRLITDIYEKEGAHKGDTGTIVEILAKDQYLLELYKPDTGVTTAMIVVRELDVEPINRRLLP
jgi:hypothetical protein